MQPENVVLQAGEAAIGVWGWSWGQRAAEAGTTSEGTSEVHTGPMTPFESLAAHLGS